MLGFSNKIDPVMRKEFDEAIKVQGADKLSRMEHLQMVYPLIVSGQV